MKQWAKTNKYILWYMVCFLALGWIDQRRGSALGQIQMTFANLTGVVIAFMLLPGIDLSKFREKVYLRWTPVCILLTVAACVVGKFCWKYTGQWISGVLNLTVWSYLIIYMVRERKDEKMAIRKKLRQPFFWCMVLLFFLMQISVYGGILPLWYLLVFGGLYLIGIPEERTEDLFNGMTIGLIVWFFIQQILAFGFRPYDAVRYRGMYSGTTQNGLFYMIVFCAFLLRWRKAAEQKKKWWIRGFYFLMSAGMVSFIVYTGGRAPLLGVIVTGFFLVAAYDIFCCKSFYRLVIHGVAMILCIAITFPVVYGCIRYLPTILHHPIWFEGEYVEGVSVCSFDPWNSWKYVSFEEAMENNVNRILEIVGIDTDAMTEKMQNLLGGMKVHAQEVGAGESPENPFNIEGLDPLHSSTDARKIIYTYFLHHLNMRGHDRFFLGFYLTEDVYYEHAHNMFLQMAYSYGIPVGILFLGMYLYSLIKALGMCRKGRWEWAVFLIAIACFGMAEMTVTQGQITIPLMWIAFYYGARDGLSVEKDAEKPRISINRKK